MEKEIKIPISKNKYIYGCLRGQLTKPLIIFIHGLTGHMNEHIFYNGARYFEKQGFSSFRFNLYDYQPDARKMKQCDLQIHANDLDLVIKYFRRKKVKKIFVVGHSYGGPTILLSKDKDYDGIILWDPTYNPKKLFKKLKLVKELNAYIMNWEYGIIVGKKMFDEAKIIDGKKISEMVKKIYVPVKIICAGDGILVKKGKGYYSVANEPKSIVVIKNASHCFNEDGVENKLFKQTLIWFKKYIKAK